MLQIQDRSMRAFPLGVELDSVLVSTQLLTIVARRSVSDMTTL